METLPNQNNNVPEETFTIKSSVKSFKDKSPDKKKIILYALVVLLVVGVAFGGVSYFAGRTGSFLRPISKRTLPGGIDPYSEITNPITGEVVLGKDAAEWALRRPLAVMVNNHVDARPQSALIAADFVYEVVAEGVITRFLAFFLSSTPEKFGPVRSTREYYLVLVKEM